MRTEIRNLTIEECLSSLGGAGGERKVYYKLIWITHSKLGFD